MNLVVDPVTQRLSLLNARACVAGCADAYRAPADIFDNQTDIQVRVLRGQCSLRGAWVGFFFRGTYNLNGWLRDFDPTVTRFGKGFAHKATTDSVEAVLPKLKSAVMDKRDSVFIGGHSKGAREAQNAAKRLYDLGYHVVSVYTFGTPRGFSFCAAREYDRKLGSISWRFENGSDIVCRVPPPPRWWHTNQEVYMPVGDILGTLHSADYKVNASLLYKLACDGRELYKEWRRDLPIFADHHIPAYLEAVNALT